jgi:hypothetical protein
VGSGTGLDAVAETKNPFSLTGYYFLNICIEIFMKMKVFEPLVNIFIHHTND